MSTRRRRPRMAPSVRRLHEAEPRAVLPRRPAGLEEPESSWTTRRRRGAIARGADPLRPGSTLYIHAPYVLNVATTNNRIRIPSRKMLASTPRRPPRIGAHGLIVHGGHVNDGRRPARSGFDNWRKTFERGPSFAAADPDREHRRRRQRDGPPLRPAGPALGRDRSTFGPRLLPGHLPRARRRRGAGRASSSGCWRSPAGSTWCTPTTAATTFDSGADRHANFGDGHIEGDDSSRSSRRPGRPWSVRRRAAPRGRAPTSPSCGSGCRREPSP